MIRYYSGLASRNLLRNRRRSMLTAAAIAVGLTMFILLDSFLVGITRDSFVNVIDYETAHVQIRPAGLGDDAEVTKADPGPLVEGADALLATVAAVEGVTAVSARLQFPASLVSGSDELPVNAIGVDPEQDPALFALADKVVEGQWLAEAAQGGQSGAQVLLSTGTAKLLGLGVGDIVTVRTQTARESFEAVDLRIAGLFNTPSPSVNMNDIYLALSVARATLGSPDSASKLFVRGTGENAKAVDSMVRAVDEALESGAPEAYGGLEVLGWRTAAASLISSMQAERAMDSVFLMLIFVIATIGVVNVTLLATLERGREIAVLKAMGMKTGEIVKMFAFESAGIGVFGGVLGVLLSVLGELWAVNVGINTSAMMGQMDIGLPISESMRGAWNFPMMAVGFIFAVVVCMLASYLPAKGAARRDPVAGLKRA